MANIFNYPNRATYLADNSRPAQQSSVSFDGSETLVDGVNIIVPFVPANVELGDMVIFDTLENKKKILKWKTYNAGTFDSARYIMSKSLYYMMDEGKAIFVPVENAVAASQIWAESCYFRLTGLDLTAAGSFTFNTYYASAAHNGNLVEWSAGATLASVVATMNGLGLSASYFKAAVLADGTGIGVKVTYPTTATIANIFSITEQTGSASVEYMNKYNGNDVVWQYVLTNTIIPGRVPAGVILRKNGYTASYSGSHWDKFLGYYTTNGSATFVADSAAGVMKEACFDGLAASQVAEELALYNKYGGDYDRYVDGRMVAPETMRGITGWHGVDDILQTKLLADIMTLDYDRNVIPAYPAMYYISKYGVNAGVVTGFEAGNFAAPSPRKMDALIKCVGLNAQNKKPLNLAIDKFNPSGNFYGNGYYCWTFAEPSAGDAVYYYGGNGSVSYVSKRNAFSVRGLLALDFDY